MEPISCDVNSELTNAFECKGDCSGYEAGYTWACEKFNDAVSYKCSGNSESFREGSEWFQKIYLKR